MAIVCKLTNLEHWEFLFDKLSDPCASIQHRSLTHVRNAAFILHACAAAVAQTFTLLLSHLI